MALTAVSSYAECEISFYPIERHVHTEHDNKYVLCFGVTSKPPNMSHTFTAYRMQILAVERGHWPNCLPHETIRRYMQ
jgi:hypothetical protein